MNYFNREVLDKEKLNTCLSRISSNVEELFNYPSKKDDFIRLHSSTLGKDEFLAFSKALLEGNITQGKYNFEYENLAIKIFKSNFCVTSNSGSSSNLLAVACLMEANKLKKGDKVIVPALAWSTTIFPLVQYGLIPVYVDICPKTFNLHTQDVKICIKEHDIKAIMLIHTYGNPADMEFYKNFCEINSLILIEDTCESMGASWNNIPVGSFGDLGTFSSYYSHHICTLEGGLTITNDKNLSDLMKSIRSHGWTRGIDFDIENEKNIDMLDPNFLFLNKGYNLRLSDPQASVGVIQLSKLNSFVNQRIKVAERFINNISNSPILDKNINYQEVLKNGRSSWFGFPIVLQNHCLQNIRELRKILLDLKVETRPFLAGDFSLQPVNAKFDHLCFNNLPNTKFVHNKSFALPCHQDLSIDDVDKICKIIEEYLSGN